MKWAAGILLALALVLIPSQCYRDGVEWRAKATVALEQNAGYVLAMTEMSIKMDSLRTAALAEVAARLKSDQQLAELRRKAAVTRPVVEAQLPTLPDSGTQVRQLLAYLDGQIEGLTAKVTSLERELTYTREALDLTTRQRDVATARVTQLEGILAEAPLLQPKPKRRLLGILPHPGDLALFLGGALTAILVVPEGT